MFRKFRIMLAVRCGLMLGLMPLLCVLAPKKAQAAPGVLNYGGSYDNGVRPSVASAHNGLFVEVHQATDGAGPLWHRVGRRSGENSFQWGPSVQYEQVSFHPTVARDGVSIVEVHQGGTGVSPLWYRVGSFEGSQSDPFRVVWGVDHPYDVGVNPSVALVGDGVLEVHQGQEGVSPLWYHSGQLSRYFPLVYWDTSVPYDNGVNPSVAVSPIGGVEVHQGGEGVGPLWCHVIGQAGWGTSFPYDTGLNPRVSLGGSHDLLEVHQGGPGFGPLWYHLATADFKQQNAQFQQSVPYDQGLNPAVAMDSNVITEIVEVHQGYDGVSPLWYRFEYSN